MSEQPVDIYLPLVQIFSRHLISMGHFQDDLDAFDKCQLQLPPLRRLYIDFLGKTIQIDIHEGLYVIKCHFYDRNQDLLSDIMRV